MNVETSRRSFLKGAAAGAAALVVGFNANGALATAATDTTGLNPFVKIMPDGRVSVVIKHFEMGQGTTTGLATLVADELDADWAAVETEFAPANDALYQNLFFGGQGTGGSTAIANSFMQYRQAGAAARALLVEAAAQAWEVDAGTVTVSNGVVTSGDRSAHFGELAGLAATLEAPQEPTVKTPDQFTIIGKVDTPRKDSYSKTDGTATFAIDVKVPGMVYAVILRSPKFGGKVVSFDASGAQGMSGFVDAKTLPNNAGVAVYATSTWAAIQARDAIFAEWDFSEAETRSTDQLIADHIALLDEPQFQASAEGTTEQAAAAIEAAADVLEAEFVFPNLAHAPMEPMNCVIEPTENGILLHDGCQFPALVKPTLAAVLGLDPEQVEINTVYAGGSFGRRATPTSDYPVEAALAFIALGGETPVKLVWTREDDVKGGYYRPLVAHRVRIGLDDAGQIAGWDHRIATQPITKGSALEAFTVQDGVDTTSIEGLREPFYALSNFGLGLSDVESPMPVLWWRAVGHTHTGYALEVAMDMVAAKLGQDPVAYRLSLLPGDNPDQQRLAGALTLAAEKAGWGTPVGEGKGRGVAVHKSFGSYVAEIVDVTVTDGTVKIDKVTCAVDCGVAINPDVIVAQMEGGIGYGLGAVMRNQITLTEGEVDQFNFYDYESLKVTDIGAIEVHIVPSNEAPTGVGEPGTPPAGPALANAIYNATGQWITRLPMLENGVDFA